MNRTTVVALALFAILSLATAPARADLTFDVRAVSGSQIIIHGPKSVAVNQNSIGGWIDFELYAFVGGANSNANDESIHIIAGNMLSTQIGRGAARGSMVNAGEIAPRVRRGIVPPLDHTASSDGWLQNLDDDPDLEIGTTGWKQYSNGGSYYDVNGMIAGRGDPFRVRNYEGDKAVAEFLLYRFTLPIESLLAESLSDMTHVQFVRAPISTYMQWREDGSPKFAGGGSRPGIATTNDGVLIHTADTPDELALIPEPHALALALAALLAAAAVAIRRRG